VQNALGLRVFRHPE